MLFHVREGQSRPADTLRQMETITAPASRKDVTPAELRQLIKKELGYNARQVTVSGGSSHTYLTITVRDAAVDTAKVDALAKRLDTWTMDNTDYCEGQSIRVEETQAVREAHAAPFVDEIIASLMTLALTPFGSSDSVHLSTGAFLCLDRDRRNLYVVRVENQARSQYVWAADAFSLSPNCVTALALHAAKI